MSFTCYSGFLVRRSQLARGSNAGQGAGHRSRRPGRAVEPAQEKRPGDRTGSGDGRTPRIRKHDVSGAGAVIPATAPARRPC